MDSGSFRVGRGLALFPEAHDSLSTSQIKTKTKTKNSLQGLIEAVWLKAVGRTCLSVFSTDHILGQQSPSLLFSPTWGLPVAVGPQPLLQLAHPGAGSV